MRAYNVLSLFGGVETGYAALRDAGVPIENYYSSEIDKNAIKVSAYNYPKIVHVGDVKGVSVANLPFVPDLLLAGFPCTDLSVAGKQGGFDNDRSGLFFEAIRILRECQAVNPKVLFLFENVPMAKRHEWVINEMLGLRPWVNNAALVSAQNRKRLWWSNIRTKQVGLFGEVHTDFPQPEDMGITLADILEKEVEEKYFLSGAAMERISRTLYSKPKVNPEKRGTINCKNNSGQLSCDSGTTLIGVVNDNGSLRKVEKSNCIDANFHKGMDNHGQSPLAVVEVITHNLMPRNGKGQGGKGHLSKTDGKSYCCDTGQTNAVEISKKSPCVHGFAHGTNGSFNNEMAKRGVLRRLTPVEVCRLFTLPDTEKILIFDLCQDTLKNLASVAQECLKKPPFAESVTTLKRQGLRELVSSAVANMSQSKAQTRCTAQGGVGLMTRKRMSETTNPSQIGLDTIVGNAESHVRLQSQSIEAAFVDFYVLINTTLGEIIINGREESLQKETHIRRQMIGKSQSKQFLQEMEEIAKSVEEYTALDKNRVLTSTILSTFGTKNIAQVLNTLSHFAENATDLFTQKRTQKGSISLRFRIVEGFFMHDGKPIIAETNQYRCLGNGWVMKVVSHIFSFLPELK